MHALLQDNWTALHYAACSGHLAVTETLLRYDADANATEQVSSLLASAA